MSRGERLQNAAGAGTARGHATSRGRDPDDDESARSGEDETGAEEEDPAEGVSRPSLWTLRGVLAANVAMDTARRNEDWDAAPPPEARTAGADAERAWLEG